MEKDVTKLLISFAESGGDLQELEDAMIQDVVNELKMNPYYENKSLVQLENIAREIVHEHVTLRALEKLG